jgi:ATP-dependent Zn protease
MLAGVSKPAGAALRATAIHEAAHAVVARHERKAVHGVSIVPDEEEGTLGHVQRAPLSRRWIEGVGSGPLTARTRREAESNIRIALAGGIAERRFRGGRHNWTGSTKDRENAAEFARAVAGSTREEVAHLRYLAIQTEQIVEASWWLIDALAEVLLARPTLTGAQVRAAISDSYGQRFGFLDI